MSTLERAIAIAAEAHAGQTDKAGAPYILHPLRVMLRVRSNNARIAAVLHDLVEDCAGWSLNRLRQEGFSEEVIAAIESVTKRDGEDYDAFVRRAAANPIGREVKLADLRDNTDPSRVLAGTEKDRARLAKYQRAIAFLEQPPR